MPSELLNLENLDPSFYVMFYSLIFIVGVCIGSFLNVLICRLPSGESLVKNASHCVKCGERIKSRDLIPLLSWILLKGKCRNCGEKISPRYPIVEFINGLIYIITFFVLDFNLKSIIYCIFFSILITISLTDYETLEIDIRLLFAILLLDLISAFTVKDITIINRFIGAIIISVPFFLIGELSAKIIERNTGEKIRGIEIGDTLLMAVSGFLIGYKSIVVAAFIGIIIAALGGIIQKRKTGESKFAFCPFLSIGLFFGGVFGERLVDLWLNLFI